MTGQLDTRLLRLKTELSDHVRVARYLGMDFERPIQSLDDGYPENAVAWVGKITERLLKQLWRHYNVPGTLAGKTLTDLISACRPHIRSRDVIEALRDIQRLRNRSAHDGFQIADEDGLTAVRRLLDVLSWYTSTGSGALGGQVPKLAPAVAAKAEFLAGLYVTLDYRPVKRFELSRHTMYQLFVRERGLRSEYVELLLSRNAADVAKVLQVTGGELLQTRLAKLTRFLILEEEGDQQIPEALRHDCRVVTFDGFMGTFVDLDRHVADVTSSYPQLDGNLLPVSGDLLTVDERSGQMRISRAGAAADLLEQVAADGGNLLIVGPPGSGKTTLLKQLVAAAGGAAARRYRFFFDLGAKAARERFADFVTRALASYMTVEAAYVYPVFCYFSRAGSVLCALDGVDEAVPELTQAGFLELFAELAEVLSAESAVVMTSRVSFLEDSPQVRRLLDGTSLISEKLVQQLHAQGVDPLRVPRFSVVGLHGEPPGGSPLAVHLANELGENSTAAGPVRTDGPVSEHSDTGNRSLATGDRDLATLLWQHITQIVPTKLLPQAIAFFGLAFLRGTTTFSLTDLLNELGIAVFDCGRVGFENFRLQPLFRPLAAAGLPGATASSADSSVVAFRHVAYQELLTAEFLRTAAGREASLDTAARPRLSDQVREFLSQRSSKAHTDDCVVPSGIYLVGPSHHLMLWRVQQPVRFDQFPVTVARYKQFLAAVAEHGSAQWDHPDMPDGYSHQPWHDRLRIPDYYDNPVYANHPAITINWWSAYAFARFEGKRLPTSLEWEAAARGTDGRLFPWGDDVDISVVNCADTWSGHPLITYDAWRQELGQGTFGGALPCAVDSHAGNISPFGVREMAGNVWEWTATVPKGLNEAVICGGSFDNPYRAVQASAKATYRRRGCSNAVGFRCAEDPS